MKVTSVRSMQGSLPQGARAVFVGSGAPTSFSKKEMASAGSQYFQLKELLAPVIRHPLVPTHTKVSSPPPGIKKEDLPLLLTSDPVSKYYWYEEGQVVEIDRGKYKYYRVVTA